MTRRSRNVITVEVLKRTVISQPRKALIGWCEGCSAQARMVSPDEAARMTATRTRYIYRQIEDGSLHFSESAEGDPFVCLHSLLQQFRES